ncbi:hypothetical protein CC78DRAFT_533053 [Lojkania enalia]|uniref:Uncharacterized protein n=1 Tax=Lojkania enalia TaxID=147567 RepID=A0A9P4N0A8_9PLEO|nr:hypothetical protein CC78DRAFT_533053 [Didymosphaeria enalia]
MGLALIVGRMVFLSAFRTSILILFIGLRDHSHQYYAFMVLIVPRKTNNVTT